MKFFHLSDLHIGLKLMNRDLTEDQKYILDEIAEMARREQPDAVIIAGDIYDKAIPSAEAVSLFDDFVSALTRAVPNAQIMMISGNHDSAPRVNIFRRVLERQNIHMIGLPPQTDQDHIEKVTMTDAWGAVNFYLLPFVKPSMAKAVVGTDEEGNNLSYDETLHRLIGRENIDQSQRNVLVSHQFYVPAGTNPENVQRMDSEITTVGNIDQVSADILELFDYAALGHIHKPMKVGSERYRYCGTPLACSVSEAGQKKGIICVELGEKPQAGAESGNGYGHIKTTVLPLEPLRQVRVITGTAQEVLKQACSDYVTVVLTDQADLDVTDLQDRLRYAFPNLLEIRREIQRGANYQTQLSQQKLLDAFELCQSFLQDLDEQEQALLQDVINSITPA